MKKIFKYLYFISLISLLSCVSDNAYISDSGIKECKLTFELSLSSFEERDTRSESIWNNGDIVYLQFQSGDKNIIGRAVYDGSEEEWTLYYSGNIKEGLESNCQAYYFENCSVMGEKIYFSQESIIYSDLEGQYIKNGDRMNVKISLSPATGRFKINGEEGISYTLSGIKCFESYDIGSGRFNYTHSVDAKTAEDSSKYIYAVFDNADRILTLKYDKYSFSRYFSHPVLDLGQSGYMDLPTEKSHNGWDMLIICLPTLSEVTISDISANEASAKAKIIDAGNGTVKECGFCYSTSNAPSINDIKVICPTSSDDISCPLTELSENTKYFIRAYAINELGVSYGAEKCFSTLEKTMPSLSDVTISKINNSSADFSAIITDDGNCALVDAGFVYSTSPNVSITSNYKVSCGKTGTLKTTVTNLQSDTKYYVRAYAVNERGTNYSEEKSFQTSKTIINPYTTISVETSYGYTTIDVIKIDGDSYLMGAQNTSTDKSNYDRDAYADEAPVHVVRLNSFYIGKTEITQKQWYVVMGSYPSVTSEYGLGDDFPVYNVSYDQCLQFISKLNTLTGKKFRLPTEAEWEFAARGGKNSSGYKFSGSNIIGNVAWYNINASGKSHEVATKSANEINLYDMSGNVWEWCSDWFGNYSISSQVNPTGSTSGSAKVIRGGGFRDLTIDCRNTVRSSASTNFKSQTLGFRVVME